MNKVLIPAFLLSVGLIGWILFSQPEEETNSSFDQQNLSSRVVSDRPSRSGSSGGAIASSKESAIIAKQSEVYKQALADATGPDGSLPQGSPTLAPPKGQTLDDPRDQGNIIIPRSNTGIYVPGEKAFLEISAYKKSGQLTPNQNGSFPMMVVIPYGEVALTLSYPELQEGAKITLFTPDGGLINGERELVTTLDKSGSVKVDWKGDQNLGHHTIVAKVGPRRDRKIVRFWVGPRGLADAESAFAQNE